jgi:hypothetical protein
MRRPAANHALLFLFVATADVLQGLSYWWNLGVPLFSLGPVDAHLGSQLVRHFVSRSKNSGLQGPVANAQNLTSVSSGQPSY